MTQGAAQPKKVLVCVHHRLTDAKPSCGARGGRRIAELLAAEVARRGLLIPVELFICFGQCERGPNVRLAPGGVFFHGVTAERIEEIVVAISAFVDERAEGR